MGLPKLERGCWCLDLKTANIVMGCLCALVSFVLMVTMIVFSVEFGAMDAIDSKVNPELAAIETGAYVMSIILVFMFLVKFIFDLAFIYGVIVERASIIKAYFIMWIVFLVLSSFTFFVNVFHYGFKTIVTELIYIGINIYAVLLSHSFYVELNTREVV